MLKSGSGNEPMTSLFNGGEESSSVYTREELLDVHNAVLSNEEMSKVVVLSCQIICVSKI